MRRSQAFFVQRRVAGIKGVLGVAGREIPISLRASGVTVGLPFRGA